MSESFDAIIIGTGVIGAATAFELAKAGWKTLSIDRNRQAGHGSTAGSCAIIRMHYSTLTAPRLPGRVITTGATGPTILAFPPAPIWRGSAKWGAWS
jgi:glycine/D-amino acid oxidase-like deaminating enzyme